MRFPSFIAALCTAVAVLPLPIDAGSNHGDKKLFTRQQHPGPGKSGPLYQLLGPKLYHEISLDLHHVAIAAAHTEQSLNQIITALNPELGIVVHSLLSAVNELEADLVSIGFNT